MGKKANEVTATSTERPISTAQACKDIEELYMTRVVDEGDEQTPEGAQVVEEGVKVGSTEDGLGSAKNAQDKFSNSGPENVSGVEDILKPEDVENESDHYLNKISQRLLPKNKKTKQKTGKTVKEAINIGTMSNDKNIFDKLYSVIMEGDEDLDALELDLDEPSFDDLDDEGGDEVTVTLSRSVAEELHSLLSDVLGDEDLEDLEDLDGDDEVFPENVETGQVKTNAKPEPAPDGATLAGNKKRMKVEGKASVTDSGEAEGKGEVKTNAKPELAKDGSTLAGNKKAWRVNNPKSKAIGD